TIRDGVSLTPRRELRALALPSEIMRLRNLSGYLKFPGPFPVASIRLKHVKRPAAAERFVPREGAVDGAQPEDGAEVAVPAAESGADGVSEIDTTAIPESKDPGKADRAESGVARDMAPEPAALQEILALPPPGETANGHADMTARAGGRSGNTGGRMARRAKTKGGRKTRRPGSRTAERPNEASADEAAAVAAPATRDGDLDGAWY
ncbi:MAG: type IV secretion system DNA-binding domain-containing protein, partial [Boseongicola sp. SB0677_bin_26]|nr:type IV secretion system DNA-binding domain-containing protein [Boseongicola sp. SB0677_bin_26]